MELRTTVQIAADITTVWDALSDPQAWEQWMTDVKSVQPATPGEAARYGSEYKVTQAWWKFDTQTIRLRDHEKPHRFAFDAATTSGTFVFEYGLQELPDDRVSVQYTLRVSDLVSRIVGALSSGAMEKQLVAEAIQLRDYCECLSAPGSHA